MDIRTSKIVHSILFFANKTKSRSIGRLQLMKLLWLSDRIHLNKYGRLILKDTYNALPHGPVPSTALSYSYNSVPENYNVKRFFITAERPFNEQYFSKSDLEVMNIVWENFGNLDPFKLRDLSHFFPEWIRFKNELENRNLPNSYPMVLDDFFENPKIDSYKEIFSFEGKEEVIQHFHVHNAIQTNLNTQCK